MAKKLTDVSISEMTEAPDELDFWHIVDVSDTTSDPDGTSKRIRTRNKLRGRAFEKILGSYVVKNNASPNWALIQDDDFVVYQSITNNRLVIGEAIADITTVPGDFNDVLKFTKFYDGGIEGPSAEAFRYVGITTAEKNALVVPAGEFWRVYDTDLSRFERWNGSAWVEDGGAGGADNSLSEADQDIDTVTRQIDTINSGALQFLQEGTELMRLGGNNDDAIYVLGLEVLPGSSNPSIQLTSPLALPTLDTGSTAATTYSRAIVYFSGEAYLSDGTNWIKLSTNDSDEIAYDNATSGLTATDVKAALDELASTTLIDSGSDYHYLNSSGAGLTFTNSFVAKDGVVSAKKVWNNITSGNPFVATLDDTITSTFNGYPFVIQNWGATTTRIQKGSGIDFYIPGQSAAITEDGIELTNRQFASITKRTLGQYFIVSEGSLYTSAVYQGNNAADPENEVDGTSGTGVVSNVSWTSQSTSPTAQNGTYYLRMQRDNVGGSTSTGTIDMTGVLNGQNVTITLYADEIVGTEFQVGMHTSLGWSADDLQNTTAGGWTQYTFTGTATQDTPQIRVRSLTGGAQNDQIGIDNIVITVN